MPIFESTASLVISMPLIKQNFRFFLTTVRAWKPCSLRNRWEFFKWKLSASRFSNFVSLGWCSIFFRFFRSGVFESRNPLARISFRVTLGTLYVPYGWLFYFSVRKRSRACAKVRNDLSEHLVATRSTISRRIVSFANKRIGKCNDTRCVSQQRRAFVDLPRDTVVKMSGVK